MKILRENYGALKMPRAKYPRPELTRSKQHQSAEFSYLKANPRFSRVKTNVAVNLSAI
jgi:hypothetical protein